VISPVKKGRDRRRVERERERIGEVASWLAGRGTDAPVLIRPHDQQKKINAHHFSSNFLLLRSFLYLFAPSFSPKPFLSSFLSLSVHFSTLNPFGLARIFQMATSPETKMQLYLVVPQRNDGPGVLCTFLREGGGRGLEFYMAKIIFTGVQSFVGRYAPRQKKTHTTQRFGEMGWKQTARNRVRRGGGGL